MLCGVGCTQHLAGNFFFLLFPTSVCYQIFRTSGTAPIPLKTFQQQKVHHFSVSLEKKCRFPGKRLDSSRGVPRRRFCWSSAANFEGAVLLDHIAKFQAQEGVYSQIWLHSATTAPSFTGQRSRSSIFLSPLFPRFRPSYCQKRVPLSVRWERLSVALQHPRPASNEFSVLPAAKANGCRSDHLWQQLYIRIKVRSTQGNFRFTAQKNMDFRQNKIDFSRYFFQFLAKKIVFGYRVKIGSAKRAPKGWRSPRLIAKSPPKFDSYCSITFDSMFRSKNRFFSIFWG